MVTRPGVCQTSKRLRDGAIHWILGSGHHRNARKQSERSVPPNVIVSVAGDPPAAQLFRVRPILARLGRSIPPSFERKSSVEQPRFFTLFECERIGDAHGVSARRIGAKAGVIPHRRNHLGGFCRPALPRRRPQRWPGYAGLLRAGCRRPWADHPEAASSSRSGRKD